MKELLSAMFPSRLEAVYGGFVLGMATTGLACVLAAFAVRKGGAR